MKAADPSIEVGYNVSVDSLENITVFRTDFSNSPPDFMISHPYSTALNIPLIENRLFSEISYVAQLKLNAFINAQQMWNQRETLWGIPVQIGQALTEWNSALCDNCPDHHPIRGISSGLYITDFWANMFEKSIQDSIDLRTMNHFALIASGTNFIHLFHNNNSGNNFTVGVEGIATRMLMGTIGKNMFPVTISGVPSISVFINSQFDSLNIPAIEAWGGTTPDSLLINLLLINRDDVNPYQIDLNIPVSWQADTITTEQLYGDIDNDTIFTNKQVDPITGNTYTVSLPAFSITSVKIHHQIILSVNKEELNNFALNQNYPNPFNPSTIISFQIPAISNVKLKIYDVLGREVTTLVNKEMKAGSYKVDFNSSGLASGIYFYKITAGNFSEIKKMVLLK